MSRVLSDERQRLGRILTERLDDATIAGLDKLIERDDTLSRLAVLRQDARDFGWRQMVHEREKRAILEPLHLKASEILPALNISQQNLLYYASLANFYTVYELRNLKPEQTRLYLLCYAWIRYRQFSDNLVDAMFFHMKQLEDESRSVAKQLMADVQEKHRRETSKIGRLLSLEDGEPTGLNAGRYEFWLYRQIRKRFQSGEFHLNDSLRHRHLSDELVPEGKQAAALAEMNIPFLLKPVKTQLKALASELHRQWKAFNRELKQGKLKHLECDRETQKLTWHKSAISRHKAQETRFYEQLPFCDVTKLTMPLQMLTQSKYELNRKILLFRSFGSGANHSIHARPLPYKRQNSSVPSA